MKKLLNTKLKDMKAITLIALVITIVVLIILAAVAINLSLGNNGIFNRAKTAKEQYQNAEVKEQTEIAKSTNQIDSYISGNRNLAPISYSTDEQDTGLKWIDGSAIFQKTWQISSVIAIRNTETIIDMYISDAASSIKQIINAQGYNSNNHGTGAILVCYDDGHWKAWCAENTAFNIITLQYTKTTD